MLLLLVACPIVFVLFRYLWVDKSTPIDGFTALGLVLAPGLLVFLLRVFVPMPYAGFADFFYWIVPAVVLKQGSSMGWGKAVLQGFVVFLIVMVCSVGIALLLGGVGG